MRANGACGFDISAPEFAQSIAIGNSAERPSPERSLLLAEYQQARTRMTQRETSNTINQRWLLDFVSDTLSDGRRLRSLCVVDDFSHQCLTCVVDASIGGIRVIRELECLAVDTAPSRPAIPDISRISRYSL